MRQVYRPLIVLLVATFILSACGGNKKESAAPAAAEQVPPAAAVAEAAAGDAAHGEEIFNQSCIACHGAGGVGVETLGKDMTASEFIAGLSDEELVAFLKAGRDTSDPLNTTGVAMPVKGGNPALSDADLLDVVAYVRTLQQ